MHINPGPGHNAVDSYHQLLQSFNEKDTSATKIQLQ